MRLAEAVWARLRLGSALTGFVLAVLAVAVEDHRLGWGAIALLAGSLLIRVLTRRQQSSDDDAPRD